MTRDDHEQKPDTQPSLLDAMADEPVPFVLTVRARRAVAPDSLPALSLLAGGERSIPSHEDEVGDALADAADAFEEDEEDLLDPRRARARALRRAGTPVDTIVIELGAEPTQVVRWTADVTAGAPMTRASAPAAPRTDPDLPSAFVSGRAAARAAWLRGTAVSSGAAMVAGLADVTPFAVRLRGEVGVVAGVLQWLRDAVVVPPSSVSVQVASAPGNALDRIAHDVASRLQVDLDRVSPRPWPGAPDREAIEVTVRIADPHLAGTVSGWRAALLATLIEETQEVVA